MSNSPQPPEPDGAKDHGASSPLFLALIELVKAALVSDPAFGAACRERARAALAEQPGEGENPARLWPLAVRDAEADPAVQSRQDVNPMLPTTCPVDLRSLRSPDFDFDGAVRAIRESASFG